MARRTALTLALLLGIASSPISGKEKTITDLKTAEALEQFIKGSVPAVVLYHAQGDDRKSKDRKSKYRDVFDVFCAERTASIRCGAFDVDKDYEDAQRRGVIIGTPHVLFYDADGKAKGRLSGPKSKEELGQRVDELYGVK